MRRHRCTNRDCRICHTGHDNDAWAWPYGLLALAGLAFVVWFWTSCGAVTPP